MSYHALDLDQLRNQADPRQRRPPFQHQLDAFKALGARFKFGPAPGQGGLVVLPTGAGKTFTTVKWLCDEVVVRNQKILWLAHSFYLLDQAFKEFEQYAPWISPTRQTLNIRVVSSSPSHDSPSSIRNTDDVLIMTTQTAIKNLHIEAFDRTGTKVTSNFRRFIESCGKSGLFVVLDEAHHAPAHGCRNLLVGTTKSAPGIRVMIPQTNLVGLTATPTYTDPTRRGWLGKIFEAGVIYQADKGRLTAEGILARPNYISMATGRELVVSDDLYTRLVREHKDLPEEIIEALANDSLRNDYIIDTYVKNRERYGKTIIFADRWFQCVYLKEKLLKRGVKADAIYSHIDADPGSAEARNKRTANDNERILNQFKYGKDKLDVLINVRMLTEGADVPTVRTVFLTRQTTSAILMAQMIGRALRGRKAGGGDEANIVLFMDEWKRLIDWATPASLAGGMEAEQQIRGYYPLEYISIRLIEELTREINSGGEIPSLPTSKIIPIGWFQTETVVAVSDGSDQTESFTEFVMVLEGAKPKFDVFIDAISQKIPKGWDNEELSPEWMHEHTQPWVRQYFDPDTDQVGNGLDMDLARIARHVAQRQEKPVFHRFEERDQYDMDVLAKSRLKFDALANDEFLRHEFGKNGNLWKVFYRSYERFATAFDATTRGILYRARFGGDRAPPEGDSPEPKPPRELTDGQKRQVRIRDGHACLCCGASGPGVKLQIDHIVPFALGGTATIDNSQTLCSVCNAIKKINEISFLTTASQLASPLEIDPLVPYGYEDVKRTLTRTVNFFYRCRAVAEILIHKGPKGRYYSSWEIELYDGNDPRWLGEQKRALLAYIRESLGAPHVKRITIRGPEMQRRST